MFGITVVKVRMPTFVAVDMQVQAHDLIEAGRPTRALLLLKRKAHLSWSEAREATAILTSGQVLPDWPRQDRTDLATRARELRDAGQRKTAIFTVRAETHVALVGKEQAAELDYAAAAYVDSL